MSVSLAFVRELAADRDRLLAVNAELLAACKEFVRKVDAGKARSVRSYTQMKAAIKSAEASHG